MRLNPRLVFHLILLLVMGQVSVFGQHATERVYDLKDGLPALDLDGIQFTSDGQVWTCFAAGEFVSHFDGIQWQNIRFADHGMPAGMKIMTEDLHGLWFYKQEPDSAVLACLLPDGSWKRYGLAGWYVFSIDRSSGSPIPVGDQGSLYGLSDSLDAFVPITDQLILPLPSKGMRIIGRQFYFSSTEPIWTIQEGQQNYFGMMKDGHWSLTERHGLPFLQDGKPCEFRISHGRLFMIRDGNRKWIRLILPKGQEATAQEVIGIKTWLHPRQRVQPAVVAEDPASNRLLLFTIDSLGIPTLLLSKVRPDHMKDFALDSKGHIWYASATGMVRTNPAIRFFDAQDPDMVTGIHAIGEDSNQLIWFGGYTGKGGFSKWDGHALSYTTPLSSPVKILPGSWTSPDGYLYFFTEYTGLMSIRNGQYTTIKEPGGEILRGYYFLPLSSGKTGLGMVKKGLGIARLDHGKLIDLRIIGKEKGMGLTNVLTLAEDKRGRIWMGRMTQGIAIYDPSLDTAITWPRIPGLKESLGVLSSLVDSSGTLWLGAQNGIYRLERPEAFDYLHNHPRTRWKPVPLPGGDTTRVGIIKESADYIIIGTAKGLYLKEKRGPRTYVLRCGEEIPDFGTEQNAVMVDSKGLLWIGTEGGALSILLSQLVFDTAATSIRLTTFLAGGQSVGVDDRMIMPFPADHRNVTFSFRPDGNEALEDVYDYYILIVNQDQDTLVHLAKTSDLQIHLPYVPAGSYSILISAYKYGVLAGQSRYTFRVARLLKENPWFWGGLAILVASFLMLWIWTRSVRQKEEMAHRLALQSAYREQDELKARALSNFFNPHFLNNSLHWVQSRYRKDPETAVIVGRLAQNVDLLFANTRTGQVTHSLKKELTIVENYLRIQEIRFGPALAARIHLPEDQAWLEEIQVPALLLQIHTENAIESGIRNRTGASQFDMTITRTDEATLVTIEDDGRGRPVPSQEPTTTNKGSTSVMNDLIELYNAYNRESLKVTFEDRIFTFEDSTYGTRVRIQLPNNFRYVFA